MTNPKSNPKNDRARRDYLILLKEAKQRSHATVDQARHAIDRFESYTGYKDFGTFNKEQAIAFKHSLAASGRGGDGKALALSTAHQLLHAVRDFFGWLSGQPGYRKRIRPDAIAYLRLTTGEERQARTTAPKRYASLEDHKRALFTMPVNTEIERRDQAIMAMLLAIGARDDALIGLRLKHVDIEASRVFQDPREVRTKFRKPIEASFFPVGEDVLDVVRGWVRYLAEEKGFGPDDPLFPKTKMRLDADGQFAAQGIGREHWANASVIRTIFKSAFQRVNLPYVHPHSVRDTLTQWAYSLRLTPEEFKAFSQNLGHDSPLTTFTSYGQVSPERQAEIVADLGSKRGDTAPDAEPPGFSQRQMAQLEEIVRRSRG